MPSNLSTATPYILMLFGLVITYIAWASKKILENIETSVRTTSTKVGEHEKTITKLESALKYEGMRITELKVEVGILQNGGKISNRQDSSKDAEDA